MSDEFGHIDTPGSLTEAMHEGVTTHRFDSQAIGDIMYASSATQLKRLAAGTQGSPLVMGASLPQWGGDMVVADADKVIFGTDSDFKIAYSDQAAVSRLRVYDINDNLIYDYLASNVTSGNFWGEHRFYNDSEWDDALCPIMDLVQDGTGECILRLRHASRPAANVDWNFGIMASLAAGVVQHNLYTFYDHDGSALCIRGLTAAERTGGSNVAGRVLIFHNFDAGEVERAGTLWVCDPVARLEVRGNHDEVQTIVKGWTTQTSNIFEVLKSDDTDLFTVTNAIVLVPDGADGAPGLAFQGNTTTGFRLLGAGSVAVEANLRCDTSLGVGLNPSGVAGNIMMLSPGSIRVGTTDDQYYDLMGYDLNGTAYVSAIRIQNADNAAAPIEIGFFGATPVYQQLKANHNNWVAFGDILAALVNLGLLDQV